MKIQPLWKLKKALKKKLAYEPKYTLSEKKINLILQIINITIQKFWKRKWG